MAEQMSLRAPTVALVFITYLSGYLYTKYQQSPHFSKVIVLNILAGIACAALIIHNHNAVRLFKWSIIVVLGLLYNSFFLHRGIRKVPLLKIFYVGLVWALVNSWLAAAQFDWPAFGVSLLYITALVLPFDIRDVFDDTVVTFPQLIGIQRTKYLAYLLLTGSALLAIFRLPVDFVTAFCIAVAVSFALVYFATPKRPALYFSFWVESCSALPFLFLPVIKYF